MWHSKGYVARVRMVPSCADPYNDPYNSSIKFNRATTKRVVCNNNDTEDASEILAREFAAMNRSIILYKKPNPQEGDK